jgi:hypothetical protein
MGREKRERTMCVSKALELKLTAIAEKKYVYLHMCTPSPSCPSISFNRLSTV